MIEERRSELISDEDLSVKDERGTNRIWIPNMIDLTQDILSEAHKSRYYIHSGSTKMDQDLKKNY